MKGIRDFEGLKRKLGTRRSPPSSSIIVYKAFQLSSTFLIREYATEFAVALLSSSRCSSWIFRVPVLDLGASSTR